MRLANCWAFSVRKITPFSQLLRLKHSFLPVFLQIAQIADIEEEIALHWSYFLRDVEKGNLSITEIGGEPTCITLSDILAFATGAASIPPLGFEKEGRL